MAVAAGITSALTGCNGSSEVLYTLPSSATVYSFNLSDDDKVLPNLDSVFFSIDLYNCEIFNADSLPYGTKTSALVPVILTESASAVELIVPLANGADTTYNYLENTTDTIDFTSPVKLRVVSYDMSTERTYTIKVNVHQVPTDTLVWSRIEGGSLPTLFSAVNEQHTTMSPSGTYYCMTRYQNDYAVARTSDPGAEWNVARANFDFEPDINTFTASTDALYVIGKNGSLYTSADNGVSWTDTGNAADAVLGAYRNRLLTSVLENSVWKICEYPAGSKTSAPTGFPVKNASNATNVSFEMSTSEQLLITGGQKADGTLSSDTWGFDGKNWAKVSRTGLPEELENLTIVPYFDVQPDTTSWKASQKTSVLLAMCGNRADGSINDTVYYSKNFGLIWVKAPESLQISTKVIPSRTHAQAFPYTGTSYVKPKNAISLPGSIKRAIEWKEAIAERKSDRGYFRVSSPLTEWEVPYIYLFGGVNSEGITYNTVFRGVITALTFEPVQ